MSTYGLNKLVGAVLLTTLVVFVIGKIGDNLVGAGGGHGPEAGKAAVVVASAPEREPAAPPAPEVPLSTLLAEASLDRGKRVFNKCKACHTISDGGKNGVGPNLWNIVNASPAAKSGFKYSSAMAKLGDKPWNYDNLNAFLTKPKAYAKGTKMTFVGLKKPTDRANVILFLRSLSANPAPLE